MHVRSLNTKLLQMPQGLLIANKYSDRIVENWPQRVAVGGVVEWT